MLILKWLNTLLKDYGIKKLIIIHFGMLLYLMVIMSQKLHLQLIAHKINGITILIIQKLKLTIFYGIIRN